jgi:hypothetical protein
LDEHELAELCGDKSAVEVTVAQAARQSAWLKRAAPQDGEDWRPRKRRRVASFAWMRYLDNQVMWSTGSGLQQFQVAESIAARPCPYTWKRLIVAPDQGSDGVCASNFMKGPLRLNLVTTWDQSHAVHNDGEGAFQNSDLWIFMMLFVVVANVPCAPWSENKRWQQCKGAMESFFSHVKAHDCPFSWQ